MTGSGSVARSVQAQLRTLVIVLLCIGPVIAGAALLNVRGNATATTVLSQSLSPGVDATAALRQRMTDANASWSRTLGANAADRARLRSDLTEVERLVAVQQRALNHEALPDADREHFRPLIERQETAARAWFSWAARPHTADNRAEVVRGADVRFEEFRTVSGALQSDLEWHRKVVRRDIEAGPTRLALLMVVLLFVSMVVAYLGWTNIDRLISGPLLRLREVVARQRAGDVLALAKVDEGAAEVRALADDFNELTQTNRALVEEQNEVLRMLQISLDIAELVHSADDVGSALDQTCARLGQGMRADRVLLYTLDHDGRTVRNRLQWHRDDLPPLPPLPPSLTARVPAVNEELRRTGSAFVIRDVLDPLVMRDERAAAFHRATGARSLVMVPVGVGETGIGVLALLTVDLYRRWRRHEVQAVQQCAGYLGQVIAQMRLNAMQDEQVRQLTALDRQKTDFMATVSHELRTPLTSISGYLELLEDGDYGELSSAQRSALGIVGRNASRLRGLIEDLLVLNKIEATGLPVSLEEVPVHTLVAGVVEMLRPAAENGRVELMAMPIDPDLRVRVDRGQLERSLINLGSNAVKFTPAGGHASFSVDSDGSFVTINVSDTGIGIPPEDRARLFDRFFRASNATAQAIPGTGLGLAIVRAIVEGHGGSLEVDSVVGKGTTMQVLLPLSSQPRVTVAHEAGNVVRATTV